MDLTRIPFRDHSFDAILCNHVLEHIPADRRAMKELRRVLKPDGWAILQVPVSGEKTFEDAAIQSPEDRERCFGQSDHVRVYGKDYAERLKAAGFEVHVDPWASELAEEEARYLGLNQKEDIYFCVNPSSVRREKR